MTLYCPKNCLQYLASKLTPTLDAAQTLEKGETLLPPADYHMVIRTNIVSSAWRWIRQIRRLPSLERNIERESASQSIDAFV